MANPPTVLPVAAWAPDMPDYVGQQSDNILNVYPRTPLSYGPIGAPVANGSALANRCQGAAAFINEGAVTLVAGDAGALYSFADGSWTDISASSGYTVDIAAQWEFEDFNGSIVATDYSDPIQAFKVGASAKFGALSGSAPAAKHMAVVKNAFLVVGNTNDGTDGAVDHRLWWPAAGDATNWPTPGSATAAEFQSGNVDILGNLGAIQAIRSRVASADAIVFMQFGAKRMMYAGPPAVFDILDAEQVGGTPCPYSPVVAGGLCYYVDYDGFYSFDGTARTPIGANMVDKFFLNDVDQSYLYRVTGAVDPLNKLVAWCYPGTGHDSLGTPNKVLFFNWQLQRWSLAEITAETLARMMGQGYTLDELWTILGYTIDALPAPLDSTVWQGGGRILLSLFDTAHKMNFLSGANLAATVETQEVQPFDPRRAFVRGAMPLVDATGATVSIGRRERLVDSVAYTGATSLNALGTCPQRTTGRYLRGSIRIPAGGAWQHIAGIKLDALAQGSR